MSTVQEIVTAASQLAPMNSCTFGKSSIGSRSVFGNRN